MTIYSDNEVRSIIDTMQRHIGFTTLAAEGASFFIREAAGATVKLHCRTNIRRGRRVVVTYHGGMDCYSVDAMTVRGCKTTPKYNAEGILAEQLSQEFVTAAEIQ